VDTDAALQQGTYVPLDAADALSKVIGEWLPEPGSIFRGIGGFIEAAAKQRNQNSSVALCGEGVSLLYAEAKRMRRFGSNRVQRLAKTHE